MMNNKIIQIEAKLMEHLENFPPTLPQLAKEFAINRTTLQELFKEHYGKPIYDYYIGKKMELAKKLLIVDKMSILDITYRLGYTRAGSLNGMFKKHYNVTLGEMRKL